MVRDGETGVLVRPGNGTLDKALCVLVADGKATAGGGSTEMDA